MAKKEKEVVEETIEPKKRGLKKKETTEIPTVTLDTVVGVDTAIETAKTVVLIPTTVEEDAKASVNKTTAIEEVAIIPPAIVNEEEVIELASVHLEEIVESLETQTEQISTLQEEVKAITEEVKNLSQQAEKWAKWLKLHGITPQRFLEKYPNHPARKFVEEL